MSDAKRIAILGSTGSIGTNTLDVVRTLAGRVKVVGLAADTQIGKLKSQIEDLKPAVVAVADPRKAREVEAVCLRSGAELVTGREGLMRVAALPEADLIVNALVGAVGIEPTMAAIRAGRDVAIANKESLVAAGNIIVKEAQAAGVSLIPIDSEHSAIYQCMRGEPRGAVRRIILTASGGPFLGMSRDMIAGVTAEEALSHPTWKMGKKVTIDSATLLNKGFEVIEARWLFGIEADRIEVVVERKSIVHSLVEFVDGSIAALLSPPDMRLPIQYALTYPERIAAGYGRLDLKTVGGLAFETPDKEIFPCLGLAYDALRLGGTAPAVLSAADEVAVRAFLQDKLRFGDIYAVLKEVLSLEQPSRAGSIEQILEADRWGRLTAEGVISSRLERRGL